MSDQELRQKLQSCVDRWDKFYNQNKLDYQDNIGASNYIDGALSMLEHIKMEVL